MKRLKTLIFFPAFCWALTVHAAIDALAFESARQERDYHSLTESLRCPQCQNNNIADSNAAIAVDMRAKVFELLNEGKSKREIVDYMVARYGNFVTYDPPLTPATVLLWALPGVLAAAGVILVLRRKSDRNAGKKDDVFSPDLSATEQRRLRELLKDKE